MIEVCDGNGRENNYANPNKSINTAQSMLKCITNQFCISNLLRIQLAALANKKKEVDDLFIESKRLMYKYEYFPSKMRSPNENLYSFLKKLRDNELIGPYSVFTYFLTVIYEFNKSKSTKSAQESDQQKILDDFPPFTIDYKPKNKENFFDHRNMDFIIRFASTSKINILPWAYVYSYDKELNEVLDRYVKPQTSGFVKSYKVIVEQKIRATNNLSGIEFESFCKLHLKIFSSINQATNIDQILSNVVFHPLYLIYLNKYIGFTKYYLRQDGNNNEDNEAFNPFEQIIQSNITTVFPHDIKSKPKKEIEVAQKPKKKGPAAMQPSGSKTYHFNKLKK